MDDLVLKFKKSSPTFYQNYKKARAIVNTAALRNTTPVTTPLKVATDSNNQKAA